MGNGAFLNPRIDPFDFSNVKAAEKEKNKIDPHNISTYENFHQVCAANNRKVATFLLKSGGADVNELDAVGEPLVAHFSNIIMFQMKRTPLHLASRDGNMDMFIFLLHKGANYTMVDAVGDLCPVVDSFGDFSQLAGWSSAPSYGLCRGSFGVVYGTAEMVPRSRASMCCE